MHGVASSKGAAWQQQERAAAMGILGTSSKHSKAASNNG